MKKYLFLTNIPTPYRTSFYNELHQCGLNFEVFYMRSTEADRNWTIDPGELKHPFYIDRGLYRMLFSRYHLHINPRLIAKMLEAKGAEIIIGGSWNDIDVLILVLLKRMGILKSPLHFWSEANYLTIGASRDNVLKKMVRKFVYESSPGVQISSGKMTELTLEKWGIKVNTYVPLPNTIEEEKFTISKEEICARIHNDTPVFLMPVRLLENVKGIVNFFSAIGVENIRKGLFLIAGTGPDRGLIENFICRHGVKVNIQLVGHCDTDLMVALYKRANVFVLPSFSDPSPLTLVEALSMRLPVLVSQRCGNHFEAVEQGSNGFVFDPLLHGSVRSAFESLMLCRERWPEMGERSGALYGQLFERRLVIENFIRSLTAFSQTNFAP